MKKNDRDLRSKKSAPLIAAITGSLILVLSLSNCSEMTVTHHDEARLIKPRGEAETDVIGDLMGAGKDFGQQQKRSAQSERERLQKKYPDATFRSQ